MKENIVKAVLVTAFAGLSAYFEEILVPLIFLLAVILIDYATGMAGAWMDREISSKRGFRGILKKLCYFAVVAVGIVLDYVITYAVDSAGIEFESQIHIVALLVTIWLIINELISILENLAKIGVPLPDFLMKLIARLKMTVENKSKIE